MTATAAALAAFSPIISRLGRWITRKLARLSLSAVCRMVERAIRRISRKVRLAVKKGNHRLAQFRRWRILWRKRFLRWANEHRKDITEKLAEAAYEGAREVPEVGDTMERWEEDR